MQVTMYTGQVSCVAKFGYYSMAHSAVQVSLSLCLLAVAVQVSLFVSPCSGNPFQLVVDLDHTLVHSMPERAMSAKERSSQTFLQDAEKSLLPEQRTLHHIDLDGCLYWVKLRPAAKELLSKLATVGQLIVFTLGSAYVQSSTIAYD